MAVYGDVNMTDTGIRAAGTYLILLSETEAASRKFNVSGRGVTFIYPDDSPPSADDLQKLIDAWKLAAGV